MADCDPMETEGDAVDATERIILRKKIGGWGLIAFGLLLSYVFVYPILLFGIEPIYDKWDWVEEALDFSVVPLELLYDSVPAYETFIDWLDSIIIP